MAVEKEILEDWTSRISDDQGLLSHNTISITPIPVVPKTMTPSRRRSPRNRPGKSPEAEGNPETVQSSVVSPDVVPSSSKKRKLEAKLATVKSPNSDVQRPSPQECAYVVKELGKLHPDVLDDTEQRRNMGSCGRQTDILDGVISTMLSQNTTNANSTRAFANLKKAFHSWEQVVKLETTKNLEDAIRCAGLAQIRAGRIMKLCKTLQEERQSPSLEYLRDWSNEDISKELIRFPGLGKKTISCVLLFTLGREEFPVDTHVHRISKQLKWIPSGYSRDDAYDYLNETVPSPLKLDLHCLLIEHGRQCHRCAARGKPQFPPKDGTKLNCPLVNLSKTSFQNMATTIVKVKTEL
jgi:endonuclease-3